MKSQVLRSNECPKEALNNIAAITGSLGLAKTGARKSFAVRLS
jgi:hypothetical protein